MTIHLVWGALAAVVVGVILYYATRILITRLRSGESRAKSFLDWIKHLIEALLGL